MAVKKKKAPKPVRQRDGRWTIRGVPVHLQKAAGDAARARQMTLGQWLAEAVGYTLSRDGTEVPPPAEWRDVIEGRLARLEAVLAASGR